MSLKPIVKNETERKPPGPARPPQVIKIKRPVRGPENG